MCCDWHIQMQNQIFDWETQWQGCTVQNKN